MAKVMIDAELMRRRIYRRWVRFPFTHWLRRGTAS